LRIARRVAFGLVCFLCVWVNVLGGYMGRRTQPHAPLFGVWTIDSVTGWPDGSVPQKMTLDGPQYARVDAEDGRQMSYLVQYDEARSNIRFTFADKGALSFHWDNAASGKTELHGEWMGAPVMLSMHRDPEANLLISRGFHWVQEEPFNH
jgi:hypothetical protein